MIQKVGKSDKLVLYGGGALGIAAVGGIVFVAFQVLSIVMTGITYLLMLLPIVVFAYMWPTIAYSIALARRTIEEKATRMAPIQALEVALISRKKRLGELQAQYSNVSGVYTANAAKITKLKARLPEEDRKIYEDMMEKQRLAVVELRNRVKQASDAIVDFETKIDVERARAEIAEGNKQIAGLLNTGTNNPNEQLNINTAFNQIDRLFGEAESALELADISNTGATANG